MEDDDDISEFGTEFPDPNTLCAVNEFRDGWVMLKGALPFRLSRVCYAERRLDGHGVMHIVKGTGLAHDIAVCDDPEKELIFQRVSKYVRNAPGSLDVFMDSVLNDLPNITNPDDFVGPFGPHYI